MENEKFILPNPKKIIAPPVFNSLKSEQVAEEQEKRLREIADKLFVLLAEEKVIVDELPIIVSILTNKVNNKIDKSEINKIMNI
jgi:hypothetical protein